MADTSDGRHNEPLISAVITTYRRPASILKRAVESAACQTWPNLEILVVNDAPEDAELADAIGVMLEEMQDPRIRYLVHEANAGPCRARNTGILASRGAFLAFLDDDDEWLAEKLERQLAGFTGPEIGMVYSPFYNVTKDLPGEPTAYGGRSGNLLEDLLRNNDIGGTSIPLIRREVFDVCGLFDEHLQSSQDYDMWLRIAQHYEIQYVDELLSRRYIQAQCITADPAKQVQGVNAFTDKHLALYAEHPKALNYRLNRKVNKWLEMGWFHEAGQLWRQALQVQLMSHYNITEPLKGLVRHVIYCREACDK